MSKKEDKEKVETEDIKNLTQKFDSKARQEATDLT